MLIKMSSISFFLAASLLVIPIVASSEIIKIPASEDVYVSLGDESDRVYDRTGLLVCAVEQMENSADAKSKYPGVPIIQFDISNLNISKDDVAFLVLKASSIARQENGSIIVAILTVGSDWNESSSISTIRKNIIPSSKEIENKDLPFGGSNSDSDEIFIFDVSKKLKDARKFKASAISFLLQAAGASNFKIDFMSSESGQGPYLIIMPFLPDFVSAPKTISAISGNLTRERS